MFRSSWLILLLFATPAMGWPQEHPKWSGTGVQADVWMGKIIRHTKKFTGPIPDQSYALQLNILKQTWGQKDWHQRRNFPQVGLGFIYINYNRPDIYGSAFGVYPNIQLPIIRRTKWEWVFNAGMGLGYVTKPYQRMPVQNLENVAIGGHLNNVSPFATDLRWKIDRHWDAQAGFSFVHVSNAAFQQPNLGINMWGVHLGVRYFPLMKMPSPIHRELSDFHNNWRFNYKYSMAFIEKMPADGPLYPVYMLAAGFSHRYWNKNKVHVGFDYSYNTGTYAFLKSIEDKRGEESASSYQVAAFVGNEFLLGRVGVLFQLGFYLKESHDMNEIFYQKLGGVFYFYRSEKGIIKDVYGTALLKTHKAVAEFPEFGLGIAF